LRQFQSKVWSRSKIVQRGPFVHLG
jgi:hypothetical protein